MSLSVVQVAKNFASPGSTSLSVTISTTAGNLLVIYCMEGTSNTATVTISDSASQTWTQTSSGYASSASTNRSAMFYIPNSAAVTSVTTTWTANTSNIGAIVYEISGADLTSPADGSVNSSQSGSITSLTSGSLTTASPNDILIYGVRSQSDETTWTAGAGYTIPTNGTNTRQGSQYKIVSATQSGVNTSMSWNAAAPGAAGIFAAFKAPATFQPDEDFWENLVTSNAGFFGSVYLPDPEEIPIGSLFSLSPDEDFWINPVPSPSPLNVSVW